MAVYRIRLPETASAATRRDGLDSVLVAAASSADALAMAKAVRSDSGYSAEAWDAATVTTLAQPSDLTGFRLRVTIFATTPIVVTVTAGAAETIDDMGTAMATALNALSSIAGASYNTSTNLLTVADEDDELSANLIAVEMLPPIGDATYTNFNVPIPSFVTSVTGRGGSNEVQTLTIAAATAGTYTITYAGQTTSALAYNANAATVQAALIALSNLATGDVVVTGTSVVTGLTLTFGGTLAGTDVAEITATLTGLGSAAVTTTTAGSADPATNEVQSLAVTGYASGTFTATYDGQTTGTIAYNAAAAAVQTALRALSNIEDADMVCAGGPLGTAPVTMTFQGALAATNVAQITLTTAGLVLPTETIATSTIGGALTAVLVASTPPQAYSDL